MCIVVEIIVVILQIWYAFLQAALRWALPRKLKSIENEVCLVTGSGNGIGRQLALEFSKRGATLVLWDIDKEGNEGTAELIRETGGKAFAETCDISNRDEVYKMAQKAKVVAGDVTMLVNNAGIVYGKEFLDMRDNEIEKTFQVNALAHVWTIKAFLPKMVEKNHGHIVTIGSMMGLVGGSHMVSYTASKHAAVGLIHSLELDFRRQNSDGVKTTLVCPSHVDTGMFSGVKSRFPGLTPPLPLEYCAERIVRAVLTNSEMVVVPGYMYLWHIISAVMPHKVILIIDKFAGLSEGLAKFIPNRKYQREAAEK